MAREIRGRYSGGVVLPLEDLDLEEGTEVTIAISDEPSLERKRRALRASFGGWKGSGDPDELIHKIYAARKTGSRPASRPKPF